MKMQQTLVILSVALLTGCATTDDPREGGFFGGVQGISSGAYERRAQEREENLAKMRAMQKELETETASLDAQKHQRQVVLEREKSKLATLNKDVKALDARLAKLSKEQGASDKRVADLQHRLSLLKGQLSDQQTSLDALEGGVQVALMHWRVQGPGLSVIRVVNSWRLSDWSCRRSMSPCSA